MKSDNYTIPQAAEWFCCTPPTVYKLINSGELKTFKVGRRRFTSEQALIDCRARLEKKASA